MMKRTKTTTRLGRRPTCLVGLLVLLALVTPSVAHAQLGRPTEGMITTTKGGFLPVVH